MALLKKFKCKQCNFEIVASATPYVPLMSGLFAQCYCKECNTLVTVEAGENYQIDVTQLKLQCSNCNKPVSVWSPDMGCPKCGGAMKKDDDYLCFAD
ncbi:MAG: hydrogenase maturation nickel metallochaperone HypA [Bacteroidales bacterium]|nr:hydrogenase maturation nickel metallochaperone HypA [Bacteroidales bacterium]